MTKVLEPVIYTGAKRRLPSSHGSVVVSSVWRRGLARIGVKPRGKSGASPWAKRKTTRTDPLPRAEAGCRGEFLAERPPRFAEIKLSLSTLDPRGRITKEYPRASHVNVVDSTLRSRGNLSQCQSLTVIAIEERFEDLLIQSRLPRRHGQT
jgi:hypothetical protein